MRIKFNHTDVYEITSFEICLGSDGKNIEGFLRVDGGAWKEIYGDCDSDWDYRQLGVFTFGKYKGDEMFCKAQKEAATITNRLLQDGYIDLDQYTNFHVI